MQAAQAAISQAGIACVLLALIESPCALNALPKLARMPEVAGLMLGSEDFSAVLGVDPDGGALETPVIQIANAAAARGTA